MLNSVSDPICALQVYCVWISEIVKSFRYNIGSDWRFAISFTVTKDLIVQAAYNFLTITISYRYSDNNSNDIDPA